MSQHTVLLHRQGHDPAQRQPLTDFAAPAVDQLEARMLLAARLGPTGQHVTVGLNLLLSAATPLLAQVTRVQRAAQGENLHALNERLASAVRLFEHHALREGADASQVMAARYVLCTVADEAVVTTAWGNESAWSQISLLSRFHNETFGGEKVFQLLEQLLRNPLKHLDTLELLYVCLALGFQGKYRVQPRGPLELEDIRDNLYRQIRHLRGEVVRELSPHWQGLEPPRSKPLRVIPGRAIALATLTGLVLFYAGFHWALQEQRNAVLRPYHVVDITSGEGTPR